MGPDPYTSGIVGIIPGFILFLLYLWFSRKNLSKLEEKSLFVFFIPAGIFLVGLPLFFLVGSAILGMLLIVFKYIGPLIGIDLVGIFKVFVKTYIYSDSIAGVLWSAVIGVIPFLFGFIPTQKNKRSNK